MTNEELNRGASTEDVMWGRERASELGVSPVVAESERQRIMEQTAHLLAGVRRTKRELGLPI